MKNGIFRNASDGLQCGRFHSGAFFPAWLIIKIFKQEITKRPVTFQR